MFPGDSPRPNARSKTLQWFRFTFTAKRVAHHRLDEPKNAQRHFAIGPDPIGQVLAKMSIKDREPHAVPLETSA